MPSIVGWLGLASVSADERQHEHAAELIARSKALKVAQDRLDQLAADSPIPPEKLAILRARHEYRVGRLPRNTADGLEAASIAAELRTELISAEWEYIYRLARGRITDEARRRMEL